MCCAPTLQLTESLAQMCVLIHTSVGHASDRFYTELRRRYYTTPKSYLDLIGLYLQLLGEKRWAAAACCHRSRQSGLGAKEDWWAAEPPKGSSARLRMQGLRRRARPPNPTPGTHPAFWAAVHFGKKAGPSACSKCSGGTGPHTDLPEPHRVQHLFESHRHCV